MKTILVIATALWWVTVQTSDATTAVLEPTSPLQGNLKEPFHSESKPLKARRERRQSRQDMLVEQFDREWRNRDPCEVSANASGVDVFCEKDQAPFFMISVTADSADGTFQYKLFPDGTGFSAIYDESQQLDVTFTETTVEGEIKFPIDRVHMQDGVYTVNSKILQLEVTPSATFPIDEADCNRHLFLVRSGEQVIRVEVNRNLGRGRDPPRSSRYKRGNGAQGRRLTENVGEGLEQVMPE